MHWLWAWFVFTLLLKVTGLAETMSWHVVFAPAYLMVGCILFIYVMAAIETWLEEYPRIKRNGS